jgi:hypothetical protein
MLQTISQSDFQARVKAINRTLKWLARASGNDPMTAYRGPKRLESYDRQARALIAEERRLLKHLLALHGCTLIDANVPGLGDAPPVNHAVQS